MANAAAHHPRLPHSNLTNGALSKNMPHIMEPRGGLEEPDDFEKTLLKLSSGQDEGFEFMGRDLEVGEKADDAVDFENISDDDLADDEDGGPVQISNGDGLFQDGGSFEDLDDNLEETDLPTLNNEDMAAEGDGFDDLFGDLPSSSAGHPDEPNGTQQSLLTTGIDMSFDFEDDDLPPNSSGTLPDTSIHTQITSAASSQPLFRGVEYNAPGAVISNEQQLQQALFAMSGSGSSVELPPAPPENVEELLASLWPKFKRNTIPQFMDLLPPKKAHYVGKTPLKAPKAVNPTKVSLELAQDQEKSFRAPQTVNKRVEVEAEQKRVIPITESDPVDQSSDDDMDVDSDVESRPIGGVTWQDLQILCEDWDCKSLEQLSDSEPADVRTDQVVDDDLFGTDSYDWDQDIDERPTKVARLRSDIETKS